MVYAKIVNGNRNAKQRKHRFYESLVPELNIKEHVETQLREHYLDSRSNSECSDYTKDIDTFQEAKEELALVILQEKQSCSPVQNENPIDLPPLVQVQEMGVGGAKESGQMLGAEGADSETREANICSSSEKPSIIPLSWEAHLKAPGTVTMEVEPTQEGTANSTDKARGKKKMKRSTIKVPLSAEMGQCDDNSNVEIKLIITDNDYLRTLFKSYVSVPLDQWKFDLIVWCNWQSSTDREGVTLQGVTMNSDFKVVLRKKKPQKKKKSLNSTQINLVKDLQWEELVPVTSRVCSRSSVLSSTTTILEHSFYVFHIELKGTYPYEFQPLDLRVVTDKDGNIKDIFDLVNGDMENSYNDEPSHLGPEEPSAEEVRSLNFDILSKLPPGVPLYKPNVPGMETPHWASGVDNAPIRHYKGIQVSSAVAERDSFSYEFEAQARDIKNLQSALEQKLGLREFTNSKAIIKKVEEIANQKSICDGTENGKSSQVALQERSRECQTVKDNVEFQGETELVEASFPKENGEGPVCPCPSPAQIETETVSPPQKDGTDQNDKGRFRINHNLNALHEVRSCIYQELKRKNDILQREVENLSTKS
eukprot:Nk52_evm1s147 gene=Nk52_evmTU1s147